MWHLENDDLPRNASTWRNQRVLLQEAARTGPEDSSGACYSRDRPVPPPPLPGSRWRLGMRSCEGQPEMSSTKKVCDGTRPADAPGWSTREWPPSRGRSQPSHSKGYSILDSSSTSRPDSSGSGTASPRERQRCRLPPSHRVALREPCPTRAHRTPRAPSYLVSTSLLGLPDAASASLGEALVARPSISRRMKQASSWEQAPTTGAEPTTAS